MPDVSNATAHRVRLPQIVPIVLREAARLRSEGELTQSDFEQKLERLKVEELLPRGFELLVRELPNGTTRFLVKDSRIGCICELIDCGGKPSAASGSRTPETAGNPAVMTPLLMGWEAGA